MFAVVFEVEPKPERFDDYLRIAGELRPDLLGIDGFLDNRRFSSRRHPGRLLSLSLWRDEASVIRWRTHAAHKAAQLAGRTDIFRGYHLRVGEVISGNAVTPPRPGSRDAQANSPRAVSVVETPDSELPPSLSGLLDWDLFDGITIAGQLLMLLSWQDAAAMLAWPERGGAVRHDVRVVRDYGLRDRAEAPGRLSPL